MVSVSDRVSVIETLVVPVLETVSVNDRVSDIGMSAALEIVSVSDRVSESETVFSPILERLSVRDRVSESSTLVA